MRVSVDNLNFGYDYRLILQNLTFKIPSGGFLILAGNNGSGKSTLIKCLLGINKIDTGHITIDDIAIQDYRQWLNVGYVSQRFDEFNYEFPITVNELIYASCRRSITEKYKLEILDRLNIITLQNENINNLSGGQLQRVFIARSLMNKPKLLILDEPTASIDSINVDQFYNTLNELNKEGITIILITHDILSLNCDFSHILNLTKTSYKFQTSEEYKSSKEK